MSSCIGPEMPDLRPNDEADVVIIGGGFYGCCLALFVRSLHRKVVILERSDALMTRASAVNQARVHNGFHYPRSFVTAVRSIQNFGAFNDMFRPAIVDDFEMLYAISRRGSKVSANRFHRMFAEMGSAISVASSRQEALFSKDLVEQVFACREHAFDWTALRTLLLNRLSRAGIEIRYGAEALAIIEGDERSALLNVQMASGDEIVAQNVFNASYSQLNALVTASGLAPFDLKHEWTEIALIEPAEDMGGVGVTVMDGAFFSTMPYPAEQLYSLTHVRYTPHLSWVDQTDVPPASVLRDRLPRKSRWYQMIADARRYMPCLREAAWQKSLFEVKTVLAHNESDDGRPILFHRHPTRGRFYSVLGGKIDNVFDLFKAMTECEPRWRNADMRFLAG